MKKTELLIASEVQTLFAKAYGLHQKGQVHLAQPIYEQIVAMDERHADAHLLLGVIAQQSKNSLLAVSLFQKVIAINPGFAATYSHLGVALKCLNRLDSAIESYDKAIALDANFVEAYFNRAILKTEMAQYRAAVADYDAAISLRPQYAEAYSNRGIALRHLNLIPEAIASYREAIRINPLFFDAHYNQSLCLLQLGEFIQGWQGYEWRWKCENISAFKNRREFSVPMWLGAESLSGKTLYIYSEQGLGDTLQFCRYIHMLKNQGARIILEVQQPLADLLKALDGVDQLLVKGEKLPHFDFQIPLMSLPLACKTSLETIPSFERYIHADQEKTALWALKLGEKKQFRIGLVWSGNPAHKNDRNRSLRLNLLLENLPKQYQYVSLQKEYRTEDLATLKRHPEVLDFSESLVDFSDTAALCESLDMVISVDTSVAHLAGALGKAVLILLPFNADWRWLLNRRDSPWYPSATLIRQITPHDWHAALEEIKGELARCIEHRT